jgi:oligopeptide/dipeptide ABC transporter ATP-binding protein
MSPLLQVTDLKTSFNLGRDRVLAVDGISFSVAAGETLALVGESGCGKSVTALSLLRLVPPPGRIDSGSICFDGEELLSLPAEAMRTLRGNRMAMVFQEPMTALNPVLRIGDQIGEVLQQHQPTLTKSEVTARTIELLHQVGIPAPEQRLREYPHQLSGGLRQRVVIAMALACDPQLLIADEPTTALDVTIQAQIMALLARLQRERGMALLLITHDLGIVAEAAQQVAIMYAGHLVERAPVADLFAHPSHPYTIGLLASVPRLGARRERLAPIPGQVPGLRDQVSGCPFHPRCPEAIAACAETVPQMVEIAPGHHVRCLRRS